MPGRLPPHTPPCVLRRLRRDRQSGGRAAHLYRPLVIENSGNSISVHVPRTHVARAVEGPVVVVVVVERTGRDASSQRAIAMGPRRPRPTIVAL